MTLPLDAADRPAEVAALAGMMLGVGYTLSALLAAPARRDARPHRRLRRGPLDARRPRRRSLIVVDASFSPARLAAGRSSGERPPASGVQLIGPTASSSAPPSNSSGNGSSVSSSTSMHDTGCAASIARAVSASVTAGPPRWKTRAPSVAARAAATNDARGVGRELELRAAAERDRRALAACSGGHREARRRGQPGVAAGAVDDERPDADRGDLLLLPEDAREPSQACLWTP